MHEDVRTAAVRESLVGNVLSQKKFFSGGGGAARFEFALEEDESH
jgi:hypothetical protein